MFDVILFTPFNEGKNLILDGCSGDRATIGQPEILTFTHLAISLKLI